MESNQPSEVSQLEESLASLKEKYEESAKIQAEWQEKVDNAKFIVTYTSEDNRVNKKFKKELEEYKKLKNFDLTDSLNGKVYDIIKNRRDWFTRSTLISDRLALPVFISNLLTQYFKSMRFQKFKADLSDIKIDSQSALTDIFV